ncbi:MAG: beta-ketoacyl synthase N-terminal-like domain-containing protein, partial [Elusimicrobia bacterium]|nr:beta-ketoacyl synthase N-terminal-like domain-containing protein [Elusimicrobiota bacterium]
MKREEPKSVPIAVIGLGCMFPQAADREEYWANIKNGVDAITDIPASHWSAGDYFDSDPKKPDFTYAKRGGFLKPVDFDPGEFGIAPNALEATDSAQLLGLVAAGMALRDAGYGPGRDFDRSRVSVVLGVTGTLELVVPLGARLGHPIWRKALAEAGIPREQAEWIVERIKQGYVPWQESSFPGLLGNVVSGRIANRYNLGGTNCVVDAACASSLSALNLAGLELAARRASMVVTGGVDCFNDIFMFMCFSKTPALSPSGDIRPFDAQGDGTMLGEGLGMLVLKRLDEAERDGDRVYAVLKGLGSSSDGRGKSIYAPSAEGQTQALAAAYEHAGFGPETVELVEAHGTGTTVGDAAEVRALTEVFGKNAGGRSRWCALGSVKSMIGHTKAASGAAGLIKTVLALHHKVLPPTIKVRRPIADLAAPETPFYLN